MAKFDLTPVAAAVSDAAGAEATARDKWSRAGKALAKAGVTSDMLVKPTKSKPNDAYEPEVLEQVRAFIIQGVSAAKKKDMTFDAIVPCSVSAENPKGSNKWTVALLLSLNKDQLREIDDDVLKTQRRSYQQLIDGPMINRIRQYIDKANGVEKPKGEKEDKEEKTESADPIVLIQGWINTATKMVDVADVSRFQDAGHEMIACLRRVRKS